MGALALVATCASAPATAEEPTRPNDGVIEGNVFRNERLNLRLEIPPGYGVQQGRGADLVTFGRKGARGSVTVACIPTLSAQQMALGYLVMRDEAMRELRRRGVQHVDHPRQEVTSAWGRGWSRSWHIVKPESTTIGQVVVVLPVCDDRAMLAFTAESSDPTTRALLDGFIASFAPIDASRRTAACQGLRSE